MELCVAETVPAPGCGMEEPYSKVQAQLRASLPGAVGCNVLGLKIRAPGDDHTSSTQPKAHAGLQIHRLESDDRHGRVRRTRTDHIVG